MGRRSNGDGYFRKLPNGKWMGQIMVGFKENGKKNVNIPAPGNRQSGDLEIIIPERRKSLYWYSGGWKPPAR